MNKQPENLFDLVKVNKSYKGYIEINSDLNLLSTLMELFQEGREDNEKLIKLINSSLLLGQCKDRKELDQKYKEIINEIGEFDEIEVYNTLTEWGKLCWEISLNKLYTSD
ncbi:hypothetical protein SAMN05216232_2155 [Virgibacillus subterraneus]|uniref:Uncharacterized protein n=1 Tax=Virgibacillus subterraneus TaxID=621109 RepID=A0A1H9EU98_9BACI|nr:hypothetical protein [Virgibacillus subterraneus]SEQ29300.1 hypothetical protein SAMN05216232_2155 [Virgibacillus subterraneus]